MITTLYPAAAYRKISDHGFAELFHNNITNQRSLFASVAFNPGDVITDFDAASLTRQASKYTVQVSDEKHIILQPEFLQYTNHSCSPSVYFDTAVLQLICLRQINPGNELTFFYPSTEWDMAEPFDCHCGSGNCLQQIQGAKYLSSLVISKYKITTFIHNKYLWATTFKSI